MAKMNRRDFFKLAGVAAPLAGLGVYELTRNPRVPLPTGSLGPTLADAAPLPPGTRAVPHHEAMHFIRQRLFPGMRSHAVRSNTLTSTLAPANLLEFQPERVESINGVLETDLIATFAQPVVNGIDMNVRTYDSRLPGPTFVARPGDVLKFRHINQFPPSAEDFAHPPDENIPHGFNVLNLHTHGLNVSPEANEDNILVQIHPGETFNYETRIPADHPTGTFWYHPHKHGSAFVHLASGMAGHLLIVGPGDLADLPEIAAAKEVELLFQELIIAVDPLGEVVNDPLLSLFRGESFLQFTVNGLAVDEGIDPDTGLGAVPPVLPMRPGEVQRWRFSLTTHLQTYRFALEGHSLYIAAWDGITQDALTPVNEVEMAPANRLDILVKASTQPGVYPFKMLATQFGENPIFTTPALTVFNVEVSGAPFVPPMALPSRLNPPRQRLPYIRTQEIVRRRRIDFTVTGDVIFDMSNPPKFVADTRQFFIDGRKFSSLRIDQTMVLDTAEEWLLTNDQSINHPFHIHVNWFQVMKIIHSDGTVDRPNRGIGRFQETIDIPFRGQVVIRHRFENFPGKFVFHCHILDHEDLGMMHQIEVIDPQPAEALILPKQGGVLVSNDFDNRIIVRVPAEAVTKETQLVMVLQSAPAQLKGLLSLQRAFTLEALQFGGRINEFPQAALIEIKYPLEIPDGKFDENTVRLYRQRKGQWTTEGINVVARMNGLLVSTVNELGTFAVLANPPNRHLKRFI